MTSSMAPLLLLLFFSSSIHLVSSSSSSSPLCPRQTHVFLNNLSPQCPLSIPPSLVTEVDGEFLGRSLSSSSKNVYTVVLFHASWCTFSRQVRSTFEVLSAMFPQVRHLAVEQSAAMPSVFSRYGIHSMPALLLVDQTKVRYHGPKDLDSLVRFYKKITGIEPIEYLADNQGLEISNKPLRGLLDGSSRKEMLVREPYLVLSLLFLCLRTFLYFLPGLLSRLKAFCAFYVPHLNLEIFGETSQLLARFLQMIDVKRVWTKVRLCKTRNFHKGATNARVWASSLASVSLGESSAARPSTPGDS